MITKKVYNIYESINKNLGLATIITYQGYLNTKNKDYKKALKDYKKAENFIIMNSL